MDRAKLKLEAKESYLYTTSVLYKLNIITEDQLKSYHEFCGVTNHKNNLIVKIQKSVPKVKCFRPSHDKLKRWEFHKGDADPHPSVPHGHKINDNNIKLDVYLGFIFKNQQKIDRESRSNIIKLWNDEKFRIFALESITHFIKNNPNYKWRKRNPTILPKRRKNFI